MVLNTTVIKLQYLDKKYKGGRLENIQTFCSMCDDRIKADAHWTVNKTTDGFAVIGLGELLKKPIIFKIMDNSWRSKKEKKVHKVFRMFPHKNIVQSICEFSCMDDELRWLKKIQTPQILCNPDGKSKFTIILQEFIEGGDLTNIRDWNYRGVPNVSPPLGGFTLASNAGSIVSESLAELNFGTIRYSIWKSVALQLMFTSIELFDKLGFIYEDWNLRNILADTTDNKVLTYIAYDKKWIVRDSFGISPVFTDFSRSDILLEKKEDWHLAIQLSHCMDMMKNVCPKKDIKEIVEIYSIKVELLESIEDILDYTEKFLHLFTFKTPII
jgi:serine/threonine protein kinase